MNAKISVFVICVKAIIYLSLYNLQDCIFNARAVSVIRYGAEIIKWRKNKLEAIDRKARKLLTKLLTVYRSLRRLYWKRKNGGKGLINVEKASI